MFDLKSLENKEPLLESKFDRYKKENMIERFTD